jgi:anti-sigma regulatory factor (Ser/Thr protein kinase)
MATNQATATAQPEYAQMLPPEILGEVIFPCRPRASRLARDYIRRRFAQALPACLIADLELLTAELVTNSYRYSRSAAFDVQSVRGHVGVTITHVGPTIHVDVSDDGSEDNVPHIADTCNDTDEGGRGLRLVREIATDWGVKWEGQRTVVWFELPIEKWRTRLLTDAYAACIAQELQARRIEVPHAGPLLLTATHANRRARLALCPLDGVLWWHWIQRPHESVPSLHLTPVYPADDATAMVDAIAAALGQA